MAIPVPLLSRNEIDVYWVPEYRYSKILNGYDRVDMDKMSVLVSNRSCRRGAAVSRPPGRVVRN